MNTESQQTITLHDDLVLKVSSLLLEDVGSYRTVNIELASFPLDEELTARNVISTVRLTKLDTSVLAQGSATGSVELECVRCLNQYDQPFDIRFTEQFRQITDVLDSRRSTPAREEEEDWDESEIELAFEINDAHELDLTELLRQWIVLALPTAPNCGPDCPGPQPIDNGDDVAVDDRFAALQQLLDNEEQ